MVVAVQATSAERTPTTSRLAGATQAHEWAPNHPVAGAQGSGSLSPIYVGGLCPHTYIHCIRAHSCILQARKRSISTASAESRDPVSGDLEPAGEGIHIRMPGGPFLRMNILLDWGDTPPHT